jgi:copper chaperone NosL
MTRGRALLALLCALAAACSRPVRCATCGMKIDRASPWTAELTFEGREVFFDTPRCAIVAFRGPFRGATEAHFREYYSQETRPAAGLSFIVGSDVLGPMGPDLVPVEAGRARRFALDHNGAPPRTLEELRDGELP